MLDFQYLCIFLKHFMQLSFSTLYFAQFRPIFKHLHIPQVASGYIAGVTIQSKPEDHSSRFNLIPVSPSFFLKLIDEYRLQREYVQDKLYS